MRPNQLEKTVRINMLKGTREKIQQNLRLENINSKYLRELDEGLIILSNKEKIGSSQTYLNGEIMPQGLGSMLTVDALDPKPGDIVLDMASAPGGKATFIGERLKGSGLVMANDISHSRIRSLRNNLARHGIENVVIYNKNAVNLRFNNVDKILLDAPCTGEGLIVSQPSRRLSRTVRNSYDMQKVQIQLLKHAIKLLKPNGQLVYSTCSLSPIENENVIQTVLDRVKLEKIEIIGDEGLSDLDPSLRFAKRLLPSKYKCDGFFISKMRKLHD